MRRVLLLCVILFSYYSPHAQQLPEPETLTPEEYDPAEFPHWAQDIRRLEVISIGTFPLTFLVTSLIYDFSIAATHNFSPTYSIGSQRSNQDILIIAGSAAGASFLLGLVDLFININKRAKQTAEDEP